MAVIDSGTSAAGKANVDANFNLRVNTPGYNAVGVEVGGGPANGPAMFSENDSGTALGVRSVASPETDNDYRLRVVSDTIFDSETFNYAAQNTGKHTLAATTLTASFSATGLLTNAAGTGGVNTGLTFGTYATFPLLGAAVLYCEFELGLTKQPTSNTVVNFGAFQRGAATAYTPLDGAYFQLENGVWNGVLMNNGVPTIVPLAAAAMAYVDGAIQQYILAIHPRHVEFWVDNVLVGTLLTPPTTGLPFLSGAVPLSLSHSIVGGPASALDFRVNLRSYNVSAGGFQVSDDFGTIGNRMYGSYQGLSGGTMGSLANFALSANPAAAVPTPTTAALGSGFGGQFWETDTLAVTTDGIISSFQVPAASVAYAGRRFLVTGAKIDSFVQTALTGGGYNAVWTLAFGHTSVSLATTETATSKAPRRLVLGSNSVPAAAAALTQLSTISIDFADAAVFVNPGEFIQTTKKKVGTAPSAGVIAHMITLLGKWE